MTAPKVFVGIPVRMGSSRFPGKPLCKIKGVPMVEHIYRRSCLAQSVDNVFVAACDQEINEYITSIGGQVVMTPKEVQRPGLRVASAAQIIDIDKNDIVAVVQGDEPLVDPETIDLGIQCLFDDPNLYCANLCAEATTDEWNDINVVKAVTDNEMNLLYLSRSPIPSNTRNRKFIPLKQIGIFFFRMNNLIEFQSLPPTTLEHVESIELVRALEHGKNIKMVKCTGVIKAVDTELQRQEVERLMDVDKTWPRYKEKCFVAPK